MIRFIMAISLLVFATTTGCVSFSPELIPCEQMLGEALNEEQIIDVVPYKERNFMAVTHTGTLIDVVAGTGDLVDATIFKLSGGNAKKVGSCKDQQGGQTYTIFRDDLTLKQQIENQKEEHAI